MDLFLRNEKEIADAVEAVVAGISEGLRAARDRGIIVRAPEGIQFQGVLLVEANAETETATSTKPSTIDTATETVTTESTSDNTQNVPARTTSRSSSETGRTSEESSTSGGRTTISRQSGGDERLTLDDYKPFEAYT